jgi:hypothetical protein
LKIFPSYLVEKFKYLSLVILWYPSKSGICIYLHPTPNYTFNYYHLLLQPFSISSCYKKHTQSAASQTNPVFKISFSDVKDNSIKLIEFSSESEYWLFQVLKKLIHNISSSCTK